MDKSSELGAPINHEGESWLDRVPIVAWVKKAIAERHKRETAEDFWIDLDKTTHDIGRVAIP